MYNRLIFENFFNDERQSVLTDTEREIALSLITPKQVIHAEPMANNPLVRYHLDLSLQIISDIYKIEKPTSTDRKLYYLCLLSEIAKVIKNDEKNFIIVRYIMSRTQRNAILEFPYYITPSEYKMVKELESIYEYFKIGSSAIIHQYDPIDSKELVGQAKTFGEDSLTTGLHKVLEYFDNSSCIIDYELNAPKEYILK